MKKRGQFYLLAAFIIVIILFGTAAITNRSSKKGYSVVYDLSKEIDLEGALLQEYGVINSEEINDLFTEFLQKYSAYVSDPSIEMVFIYGNATTMFRTSKTSSGEFSIGGIKMDISGIQTAKMSQNQEVEVKIKGNSKNFVINEGESFYYFITQETSEGSVYTTTSQD